MTTNSEAVNEVLKRLDALAAKLGVGAQYLWAITVKQQYIDGCVDALTAVGLGVLAALLYRHLRSYNGAHAECNKYSCEHGLIQSVHWTFMVVSGFLAYLATYCAVTELLNPEYAAFKSILEALAAKK